MIRRLRPAVWFTLLAILILTCCGGTAMAFIFDASSQTSTTAIGAGCGNPATVNPDVVVAKVSYLGTDQMRNAAIIVQVGQQMQVPPRGWVVAIATALQESGLRNLPNLVSRNDHDSVGLFQQRPSMGWGTVEQIMDPRYSSRKFYERLVKIPNWQTIALTDAAQDVQRSAFPDAYAKHEQLASQVVNALAGGAARAAVATSTLRCVVAGEIASSGWTVPLKGKIVSGFRTAERPTHQGVDIAAAKGTPVHAAAAGIVIKVRCDANGPDGKPWGCDRDGSPSVKGCGWFVDILHANSIMTRYCHMVVRPLVSPGQQVAPGQQIGLSGSTGHSSGPHLHFETHVNGDSSSNGAINPIQFMQQMGAPLGASP